ncbi:MAG TPA: hypothetical protein VK843_11610 [Planctomycetota bacterium]|nr:hypothetical protein [Planctomycetota bacterium]
MRSQSNRLQPFQSPSTLRAACHITALGLAIAGFAPLGSAQWQATSLHPAGAQASHANDGDPGGQSGYALIAGAKHAYVWSGFSGPSVDLHPAGATASEAFDSHSGLQVGTAMIGGVNVASTWNGTAGSWSNLNPPGMISSALYGGDLGAQAGFVEDGIVGVRAALWHGSAASYVDLSPANSNGSAVWAMRGIMQAGQATIIGQSTHAGYWIGSPNTWTDLHPTGAQLSQCWGTDGVQQVGRAILNGSDHPFVWSGSAASGVDLLPANFIVGEARGVDAGEQVGYVGDISGTRACLWSGSASSRVDLELALPMNFRASKASAIWHSGGTTFVLGTARNSSAGNREEVILWRRLSLTIYCTAKVNSLGCSPSMAFFGNSSASNSNVFVVRADLVQNHKPGILLYSNTGRTAIPFSGGTLCLTGPLRRVSGLDSGGLPSGNNCSGAFSVDMNAFRAGALGGNPAAYLAVAGTLVDCQFWGRDSGFAAPNNTQLSNAMEFEIGP